VYTPPILTGATAIAIMPFAGLGLRWMVLTLFALSCAGTALLRIIPRVER